MKEDASVLQELEGLVSKMKIPMAANAYDRVKSESMTTSGSFGFVGIGFFEEKNPEKKSIGLFDALLFVMESRVGDDEDDERDVEKEDVEDEGFSTIFGEWIVVNAFDFGTPRQTNATRIAP